MKKRKKRITRETKVKVFPRDCRFEPAGQSHAKPKAQQGFVNFDAQAPCTLLFTNPDVFGCSITSLTAGDNFRHVQINKGRTYVMIAGCEYKVPRSLGAAAGPKDIIVP